MTKILGPRLLSGGANYSYLANSNLVEKIQFKGTGGVVQVETERTFESDRDLIASIENKMPALATPQISKYAYVNDALGRRTSCVRTGVAFDGQNGASPNPHHDDWSYNDRNELTGSLRFNNGTPGNPSNPVPAQDRGFVYDPIGNRKSYDEGTNATLHYCANNLNQYTFTDDATTCPPQQGTETERFLHDLDGNLTLSNNTGEIAPGTPLRQVVYSWDAENRLTKVEPFGTPANGDKKVEFKYDYMGRRVEKSVSTYNGAIWGTPTVTRFMWYNWLMIAEFQPGAAGGTGDPAATKRYVWGLDLAGQAGSANSMEQAGGIGGLLSAYDYNGTSTDLKYVYCYDANGNVAQMLDSAATTVSNAMVARYEYDVYGNATTETGSYAESNRWRYSTKMFDVETGLGYWGYRYSYSTNAKWISNDPIGERGSICLSCFIGNSPTQFVDPLGLHRTRHGVCQGWAADIEDGEMGITEQLPGAGWVNASVCIGRYCLRRWQFGKDELDQKRFSTAQALDIFRTSPALATALNSIASQSATVGRRLICTGNDIVVSSFSGSVEGTDVAGQSEPHPWLDSLSFTIGAYYYRIDYSCNQTKRCWCCKSGEQAGELVSECRADVTGWDTYDFHTPGLDLIPGLPYRIYWSLLLNHGFKESSECADGTPRPSDDRLRKHFGSH